jgi:hypothetical protein
MNGATTRLTLPDANVSVSACAWRGCPRGDDGLGSKSGKAHNEHNISVRPVLLAIGVMDRRAMAVVTGAITVERLAPAGERVVRAIGAVVVGAGCFWSRDQPDSDSASWLLAERCSLT